MREWVRGLQSQVRETYAAISVVDQGWPYRGNFVLVGISIYIGPPDTSWVIRGFVHDR